MPTTAIIVAAGAGQRMGLATPKAFLQLAGRPLVAWSLSAFDTHPGIDAIVLMAPQDRVPEAERIAAAHRKVRRVAAGGGRRPDTVRLGLALVGKSPGGDSLVLVHDAARPLVDRDLITRVIEAAGRTGAAFPGLPPSDTVREAAAGAGPGGARLAGRTPDRSGLVLVQTPQGFRLSLLEEAFARAGEKAGDATDEAALLEWMGHPVEVVPGSPRNLKITGPTDLEVAAALLPSEARDSC